MGVKVAVSCCKPPGRIVPCGGKYEKVPATLAVASSCVEPSAVPYVIDAGVVQLIVGVVFVWVVTVTEAAPDALLYVEELAPSGM